jgi:16S rRNA (adenine1518-N6/adenine1519-N6)-dimethyltransferase
MLKVKAKKHLGQHFLTDQSIAMDIVELLSLHGGYNKILEIGPGMGVLTQYLIKNNTYETWAIDIDIESIVYLKKEFPTLENRIIDGDFLRMSSNDLFGQEKFAIIGNFPYNISSVIFFKILEEMRNEVTEIVCMLQKEVAERLASPAGNKDYGILSVFLQAYYDIEYCFTVQEHVFDPPPKVKSGVIRLKRNDRITLDCDEKLFKRVVKQAFTNRRKTLRNTLKPMNLGPEFTEDDFYNRRAETLSVEEYITLTNQIAKVL